MMSVEGYDEQRYVEGVHEVNFFDSSRDLAHFLVLTPHISNLAPHF